MIVHIGLENNFEGRSLAWALGHPGCFAYGVDGSTAVVAMGRAIPDYIEWIAEHTPEPWFAPADIDIRLEEIWEDYFLDETYNRAAQGMSANAWFLHDWKLLTALEMRQGVQLLQWAHNDLLASAQGLSDAELDAPHPGELKPIRGILMHVATANWWLLDRLDLAASPRASLSKDVDERLNTQFERACQVLPELTGVEKVVGKQGELWSPRKLLRRLVWHARDHAEHIRKLKGVIA
ncbi:MAG: DinB family protein [Anaerolineaceae bacterium]|nr:DinB family protein [Anaerolineaceae bacterium]